MEIEFDESEIDPQVAADRSTPATGKLTSKETPVDPFIDARLTPYPNTMNTVMPFNYTTTMTLALATDHTASFCFRLNSITDCIANAAYTEDAAKTDDAIDGTAVKPQMFNHWSQIYKYWHVVGSKYRLRFYETTRDTDLEATAWIYHHGQQAPPFFNGAASPSRVPDYIRKCHPYCHSIRITNTPAASGRGFYDTPEYTNGYYAPGPDYVHNEIIEDSQNVTWHLPTETPPLHEKCSVYLQRSDLQAVVNASSAHNVRVWLEIQYLVQWRDLKAKFKYPTDTTDYLAVTDPMKTT